MLLTGRGRGAERKESELRGGGEGGTYFVLGQELPLRRKRRRKLAQSVGTHQYLHSFVNFYTSPSLLALLPVISPAPPPSLALFLSPLPLPLSSSSLPLLVISFVYENIPRLIEYMSSSMLTPFFPPYTIIESILSNLA